MSNPTETSTRLAYLASDEHRAILEDYFARLRKGIELFWSWVATMPIHQQLLGDRTKHAFLKDEQYWAETKADFMTAATQYDFEIDRRAETWRTYSPDSMFVREACPGFPTLWPSAKAPRFESWSTGKYFRYGQFTWRAKWWPLPAWPDRLMSLIGVVLVTSPRNTGPLSLEERQEIFDIDFRAARSTQFNKIPPRSGTEDARVKALLNRCPWCLYIAVGDVDCTKESPAYDPDKSPLRAVAVAEAYHENVAKKLFGAPKWKLSNKAGGLHGVNGILPPELQDVDLIGALDRYVLKECAKFGIPTLDAADDESPSKKKVDRVVAEVLDTSPWHKGSAGRGGMYRTPGNAKTDETGKPKPSSVPQVDVEKHVDELPWLEPLTVAKIGPAKPSYNVPLIFEAIADFKKAKLEKEDKHRKRLGIKPGQPIPKPRLRSPILELGCDPLPRTAAVIREAVEKVNPPHHQSRMALAGALFKDQIPAEAVTSTLSAAFDNTSDVLSVVRSTLDQVRSRQPVAAWGAVKKLFGQAWFDKIKTAIREDQKERIATPKVVPAQSAETVEIAKQHEAEDAAAGVPEEDPDVADAAEESSGSKNPYEGFTHPDFLPPDPTHVVQFNSTKDKNPWSLPVKPDARFKHACQALGAAFREKPNARWSVALYHLAGMFVRANISCPTFYLFVLHAGDARWNARLKRLDAQPEGKDCWDLGYAKFVWLANHDKFKSRDQRGMGMYWGIANAIGHLHAKRLMNAIAQDLLFLEASEEVILDFFAGYNFPEVAVTQLSIIEEHMEKEDRKRNKGKLLLSRKHKASWKTLKRVLRCSLFCQRGHCTDHGDVCQSPFVCENGVLCPHCHFARARSEREIAYGIFKDQKYWGIKLKAVEGEVWVEIDDPDRPGKKIKTRSDALVDRVIAAIRQNETYLRWNKYVPIRYALGYDYVQIVIPQTYVGIDKLPFPTEGYADAFGPGLEDLTREQAVDALLEAKRTICDAFSKLVYDAVRKARLSSAALDGSDLDYVENLVEFSWLRPLVQMQGSNKAGRREMPWPSKEQIRQHRSEKAAEKRKFDVRKGTCPFVKQVLDKESGGLVDAPCGRTLQIFEEHTTTRVLVFASSSGLGHSAKEVWDRAEERGIPLFEFPDPEAYASVA